MKIAFVLLILALAGAGWSLYRTFDKPPPAYTFVANCDLKPTPKACETQGFSRS